MGAREKAIAKANADAAAAKAAAAAQAKADQSKAVVNNVKDGHSQNMHPETLKNQPVKEGFVEERDLANSASNISDNTHTGEHWDGPKRGRIIREYRKDLDSCNISGDGKCSKAELAARYPNGKA